MTKKEIAKELRLLLSEAIRRLPDDVEYKAANVHSDFTAEAERDHEAPDFRGTLGALHIIEFDIEEKPRSEYD